LRPCWQSGQVVPVLAQPSERELNRTLVYPKFRLTRDEREGLLEDLLPWHETWSGPILTSSHRVRDPHEQVFLDPVLATATPMLVSGDADLLARQGSVKSLLILTPADFQAWVITANVQEPVLHWCDAGAASWFDVAVVVAKGFSTRGGGIASTAVKLCQLRAIEQVQQSLERAAVVRSDGKSASIKSISECIQLSNESSSARCFERFAALGFRRQLSHCFEARPLMAPAFAATCM
jgi:uncharacterized protein